jgi:predicted transcriptional regulator
MRGGHHFSPVGGPWMIALIVALIVAVVAVILWLIHRSNVLSDGLTPRERKELPWEQREVLSMLRQNGGPMLQSEIVDMLPADLQEFAEVFKAMEDKGLIRRHWNGEKSSYIVTAHG